MSRPPGARLPGAALPAFLLASLLGACDPAGGAGPAEPAGDPGVRLAACEVAGSAARCGSVDVPEDRAASGGRHVGLRVVVLPAPAAGRAPDPVFVLVGGPGQGAAAMAELLGRRGRTRYPNRDVVLVDQRGTGDSNPLRCPPASDASVVFGQLFDHARLAECRRALAERADLAHYGTVAAVDDLEEVRRRLGYPAANLDAGSYGTRVALIWARRHPGGVRTLVLTGVAALDLRLPLSYAADAQAALEALFEDCRIDPACGGAFPRLGAEWEALLGRLAREPARFRLEGRDLRFRAEDLGYAVRGLLYGPGAVRLPAMIHAAHETGDPTPFARALLERRRGLEAGLDFGHHLSVLCSEDLPEIGEDEVRDATRRSFLGTYVFDEYRRACDAWEVPAAPLDREAAPIRQPLLVFSGRRDPSTPPRRAEPVVARARDALHVVFHSGGHGWPGGDDHGCRASLARAFVDAGTAAHLDASCAAAFDPAPFALGPP